MGAAREDLRRGPGGTAGREAAVTAVEEAGAVLAGPGELAPWDAAVAAGPEGEAEGEEPDHHPVQPGHS